MGVFLWSETMENYKRVILKLSGEALSDKDNKKIFLPATLTAIAHMLKDYQDRGIQVGIVVGAGNIWRGKLARQMGLDPEDADYMGMVATVINAMALKSTLELNGLKAKVLSALAVEDVAPKFEKDAAIKLLEDGYIVIFAAGTGKPHFTTDTCAALRALDIDADAIFMGKEGVEGVYTSNPLINKDAQLIKTATYEEMIDLGIQALDLSALEVLKDSRIILRVFQMNNLDNFIKVLKDDKIGTVIRKGK